MAPKPINRKKKKKGCKAKNNARLEVSRVRGSASSWGNIEFAFPYKTGVLYGDMLEDMLEPGIILVKDNLFPKCKKS